jgi:ElaA protein
VQVWVTDDDGAAIATARVLLDADGRHRIGRVCTARSARGQGVGAALMRAALERCGDGPVVIDAQSYLADWYARLGFVATGRTFVEDDIDHTEMVRP